RGAAMRYGYWLPVFGGWLRNVENENMETSWAYVKELAQRSEKIGFDLTLIAELNLNDIKGVEAPSLDAWSTAAALAAVTERIELMVAVRPTFHLPALRDMPSSAKRNEKRRTNCGASRTFNNRQRATRITNSGLPEPNWSSAFPWKIIRFRIAACGPASSARPNKWPSAWPNSKPLVL